MKKKNRRKKIKTKKYLLCIKDRNGIVVDVIENDSYDILFMEGVERAKDIGGSWQIYNPVRGNMIDEGEC